MQLGLALSVATTVFRAYLNDQSMDHLGAALRRGGIKDLLVFLPANKRDPKALEEHFKKEGLPQVADWFAKRQYAAAKDAIVKTLKELCEDESRSNDEVRQVFIAYVFFLTCLSLSSIYSSLLPDHRRAEDEPRRTANPACGLCWLHLARPYVCY